MKRFPPVVRRFLPFAAGTVFAFLIAKGRGLSSASAPARLIALSDGCFAAGLLEAGFGLLLFISQDGFFDIFSYAVRSVVVLFTPFRTPEDLPSYADYRIMRRERRRKPGTALLLTGIVFLAASAVLLLFVRHSFSSEVI